MTLTLFEDAPAANESTLRSKPYALDSKGGFYLYCKRAFIAGQQLFEPCLSCGRRLRITEATVTVRGVCGHVAVCAVCRTPTIERGLIG